MRDVSERLKRLLYLVPYVAKRTEGVAVDELATMLGVNRDILIKDLDMLAQVGPPDGDPGEYLLVTVEDGLVFIDLPQRLTRPLRLTPVEGCSLLLGIKALRESGIAPFDDALGSAESKLLNAMGRDADAAESLATDTMVAEPERAVATYLKKLVSAARDHVSIKIEYSSASKHKAEVRTIDPFGIVHHAGEWYMVGHCHKRGDTRTFRVDRIASLTALDQSFDVPKDFDLETYRREHLYVPSADAVAVRIKLDAIATTRVGVNWPVGDIITSDDGGSEIVIDCEGFEWVTGWVLGFGRHAKILSPVVAREAMKNRVSEMRAQFQ